MLRKRRQANTKAHGRCMAILYGTSLFYYPNSKKLFLRYVLYKAFHGDGGELHRPPSLPPLGEIKKSASELMAYYLNKWCMLKARNHFSLLASSMHT